MATLFLVFAGISPAFATHLRGALGVITYDAAAKKVYVDTQLLEASTWKSADTFFTFPTIYRVDKSTGAMTTVAACAGQNTIATVVANDFAAPNTSSTNTAYSDKVSQPLFYIDKTHFAIDVSCANFNQNFDYVFSQTGSNRINGIKNSTNQVIQVEAKIHLDGSSSVTPIYNSGYMANVAYDTSGVFSMNLNALAGGYAPPSVGAVAPAVSAGSAVTYSLITDQSAAQGGYGASRIPSST
jgi:hypothetical protein